VVYKNLPAFKVSLTNLYVGNLYNVLDQESVSEGLSHLSNLIHLDLSDLEVNAKHSDQLLNVYFEFCIDPVWGLN